MLQISRWICYESGTQSNQYNDFLLFISDDSMKIPVICCVNSSLIHEKFVKMRDLLKNEKKRAMIYTKNPFELQCLFRYLNNQSFSLPLDRLQILNEEFKRYDIAMIPTNKFYQIPSQAEEFINILSKTIKSNKNYQLFRHSFIQNYNILKNSPSFKELPMKIIVELLQNGIESDVNPTVTRNIISDIIENLETKYQTQKKKYKTKITALLSEINRLGPYDNDSENVSQLKKQINDLTEQLDSITKKQSQEKPSSPSKVNIYEKNAADLQYIAELLKKIQESNDEMLKIQQENEDMRAQSIADKDELESLRFSLSESAKQISQLQIQNDSLSKEVFKTQKKLDSSMQKYSESMTKLSQNSDATIQKLDKEKRILQSEYDNIKAQFDKISKENEENKKSKDFLEIELSEKSKLIQAATQREIMSTQEKEFHEQLISQKKKQIESLNAELVSHNLDIQRYKTIIQQWNQMNDELYKTKKQLEKCKKSEMQNQLNDTKLYEQSKSIEQLTEENRKLTESNEQLNKIIQELRDSYNKEKIQWETEKEDLKDQISQLSMSLIASENNNERIQNETASEISKLKKAASEYKKISIENEMLKEKIIQLTPQKQMSSPEPNVLSYNSPQYRTPTIYSTQTEANTISQLKSQNSLLEKRVSDLQNVINDQLQSKTKEIQLQKQIEILMQNLSNKEKENNELRAKMKKSNSSISDNLTSADKDMVFTTQDEEESEDETYTSNNSAEDI
ncbi:hypothetical protein TVAG_383420 [Trichomonas vaginalis G3]|uniref:Uncharacterized protein n=1 Tax=Trichomonas vaginalis (strain ATCC PRA-98 / G3) TaxID=412133 RepID=A2EZ51_TRIV3|nr:biological adhesion protein [Trichomonas vaginalis G3]EAY02039.1 hypothetical protein TVAG_383420 [Trichomonas vaginalis G3]KAI5514257.1 biological adhesion protein [Trichomonas vaginalis G3]|eukprot:XP_001314483.1 hypothetical protein [Trichomonas vaginalis G3]